MYNDCACFQAEFSQSKIRTMEYYKQQLRKDKER